MPGIDGKTLPGSEGLLRPFQQAQSIRDAFFANGATTPSFKVTVRTVRMDNTILNLTLDVDGQLLRYSHGPQAVQIMNWPGRAAPTVSACSWGWLTATRRRW